MKKLLILTLGVLAILFAVAKCGHADPSLSPETDNASQPLVVEAEPDTNNINPISFLDNVVDRIQINGGYTFLDNKVEGGSVITQINVWRIDLLNSMELRAGPAYVLVSQNSGTLRHIGGIGLGTRVIKADKVNDWLHGIPVIGRLPIDLADMHTGVVGGLKVDNDQKISMTVYLGGIKWGG